MIQRPDVLDHIPRVLVVDDEVHNRALMEAILDSEGFVVTLASNGEVALTLLSKEKFDLVLLDVVLPGVDGYEVARRIKGSPTTQNIPIIMITALADRDARMQGLHAGAEDFLSKPVDRSELCARVKNLLRLKAYGDIYGMYSELLEGEVRARTADLAVRTELLEAHATALRRNEERTQYALGAARMGVWELDILTYRVICSDSMASVLGVGPDEAPTGAKECLALVHDDDRRSVGNAMALAIRGEADFEMEFRVLWPDGSTHWLVGRARTIRDSRGRPSRMLGVGADVSERKSLEAQLRQSQKMEAVGQLAGGVAHDFNNLLTVILSYSDLVLHEIPESDTRHADLQQVINAAVSAAALTRQLLAFSRKQVMKPAVVDLNALVHDMAEMFSRLIESSIEIRPVFAADLGMVRADRGQLEQVLMNLVVNARDAMPKGGRLQVETANFEFAGSEAHEAYIAPGSFVALSVCDSGMGMDKETKYRLFEPFFTTKAPGKGTGLGLATVYGIVNQSGGFIQVHTAPGKGTTFKVCLPRIMDGATPPPSAASRRRRRNSR